MRGLRQRDGEGGRAEKRVVGGESHCGTCPSRSSASLPLFADEEDDEGEWGEGGRDRGTPKSVLRTTKRRAWARKWASTERREYRSSSWSL